MYVASLARSTPVRGASKARPKERPVRAVQQGEGPFDLRGFRDQLRDEWEQHVTRLKPKETFDPKWKRCVSTLDPPMVLENDTYESPAFRKLHVEYGEIGDGFRVVHCVITPHANVPAPIFGADIVQRGSKTTFCITDLSPVDADGHLPLAYLHPVRHLQRNFIRTSSVRPMPTWGREIFSDACVTLSPRTNECVRLWARYTLAVHRFYLYTASLTPRTVWTDSVREAQQKYAHYQRQNDKTRGVLVRHFGDEFADEYIRTVLFDDPPTE